MLKKKTLTETIYNNGDPFQVREAISATIGAWQKRDENIDWSTLVITTGDYPIGSRMGVYGEERAYTISVEAVYDASN